MRDTEPNESERFAQYLESVYQERLAADPMLRCRVRQRRLESV